MVRRIVCALTCADIAPVITGTATTSAMPAASSAQRPRRCRSCAQASDQTIRMRSH